MRRPLLLLVVLSACGRNANEQTSDHVLPRADTALADTTAADSARVGTPGAVVSPAPPVTGSDSVLARAATLPAVQGRVVRSGFEGSEFTTLQRDSGPPFVLRGTIEPEIRALVGAIVVVRGPQSGTERRRVIDVESYDIVEIDGARPVIGIVLARDRLATGADTLRLVGAPAGLRVGSKVWITGTRTGGELRVGSIGVIR